MSKTRTVELDANISPELNKQFRDLIIKRFGYKRGNISKAVEEALNDYVEKYKKE
jgi:hypothetical protein